MALPIALRGVVLALILSCVPADAADEGSVPDVPTLVATEDYITRLDTLEDFKRHAHRRRTDLGVVHMVKVYATAESDFVNQEGRFYFFQTNDHQLHYPFVRDVLGEDMPANVFASSVYARSPRPGFAASVVWCERCTFQSEAVGGATEPFLLEFDGIDRLTVDQALGAHRLVEERMSFLNTTGSHRRLFYVPPNGPSEVTLQADLPSFRTHGRPWLTRSERAGDATEQVLHPGVAYGYLRQHAPAPGFVPSSRDVLVLDQIPNDLPVVAGTITASFQTPLSHVNLLARARGTPNLAVVDALSDKRIQPLLGHLVRFEVTATGFALDSVPLAEAEAFWKHQGREPLVVPKANLKVTGVLSLSELGFADSRSVGAKAANVAELHRLLPDVAPGGLAVPFSVGDAFMRGTVVTRDACEAAADDCASEGRKASVCGRVSAWCQTHALRASTLREVAEAVVSDAELAGDAVAREATLDSLRHLVSHGPVDETFGRALDARVEAVFGESRIRLRSSTNAEDLPEFSGAGLYRSVSAQASEGKPASQRIRKVWASLWNWNAYEERTYWGIEHLDVQMAVLLHQAYPAEAANGVLITFDERGNRPDGFYVNVAPGEASVTNPQGGALPEDFVLMANEPADSDILSAPEQVTLHAAATRIRSHFAALYGLPPGDTKLDLEFKLRGEDRALVIKQVRPYGR
jgi:pyruvate, water dikinase